MRARLIDDFLASYNATVVIVQLAVIGVSGVVFWLFGYLINGHPLPWWLSYLLATLSVLIVWLCWIWWREREPQIGDKAWLRKYEQELPRNEDDK